MNEELYFLYEDLPATQKKYIEDLLINAPKMLSLIQVIQLKKQSLSTTFAVQKIYQDELNDVAFDKLVNRYYKLRKELKEWLLAQVKDSPVCLTDLEREVIYLKQHVINNRYGHAIEELKRLEKKCWEFNIFELLPEITELLIRSVQMIRNVDYAEREHRLTQYEEAQRLFLALKKVKMIGFQMQEVQDPLDYINKLRLLIRSYSQYPRFKMMYHYLAFSKMCYRNDANRQATSRHLKQYKRLRELHSNMPVIYYERNYQTKTNIHFMIYEAAFYSSKNEHTKALQIIKKRLALQEEASMYFHKGEALLTNQFLIAVYAQDYDFAWKQLELLKEFQIENKTTLHYPYHCSLLDFYSQAFPFYRCDNYEDLLERAEDYEQQSNSPQVVALLEITYFKIAVIEKNYQKAEKIIQQPQVQSLFEDYIELVDLKLLFLELLKISQSQLPGIIRSYTQKVTTLKRKLSNHLPPTIWIYFLWIEQVCEHHIQFLRSN